MMIWLIVQSGRASLNTKVLFSYLNANWVASHKRCHCCSWINDNTFRFSDQLRKNTSFPAALIDNASIMFLVASQFRINKVEMDDFPPQDNGGESLQESNRRSSVVLCKMSGSLHWDGKHNMYPMFEFFAKINFDLFFLFFFWRVWLKTQNASKSCELFSSAHSSWPRTFWFTSVVINSCCRLDFFVIILCTALSMLMLWQHMMDLSIFESKNPLGWTFFVKFCWNTIFRQCNASIARQDFSLQK